jgi:MFS family permease
MKPRIGVYLSERTAARLAAAAKRPGATKSALVETALDGLFGSDDDIDDNVTLARLSRQIEHLDRDLRIVSETVALHARFHLTVTPSLPAATQRSACQLGSARFEEFAAQVGRRIEQRTPLMQETIERLDTTRPTVSARDLGEAEPPGITPTAFEDLSASTRIDEASENTAAVREDGSNDTFPGQHARPYTETVTRYQMNGGEAAIAWRRSAPTRRTVVREVISFLAENRALMMRVFLPFAAGYYLSYLFRTINAVIAAPLALELGLGAGDLGLLTSVYFLTFAAAQIPIGVLLDRYGPRRIQSVLLMAAAVGAALFAASDNFMMLIAGRALMGLGVAAALTGGLKALVLWFPRDRLPVLNGSMVMLGALGAVTATSPAELLLGSIGWRGLFCLFAAVTAGCAAMVYLVVPEVPLVAAGAAPVDFKRVYTDPRFWRVAPLSATCIGTAWALHGLWAAQWLTDVESLDRNALVWHLFTMAVAVSLGAILLGVAADRLGRRGVGPQALLGFVAIVFIAAQLGLILRWPLPSYLLWAVVGAVGAATVLSYATLAEYFPKELAGRANGLLNFLHVGAAFILQYATGIVLQQWAPVAGHYPEIAFQTAFALNLALQIVAGAWFGLSWVFLRSSKERGAHPSESANSAVCTRTAVRRTDRSNRIIPRKPLNRY